MAEKPKIRALGSDNFLEGKLLIALPGMPDPRFEKSVIFMCAHSVHGAMGLIINKRVEGLVFRDMMEKLEIRVSSERRPIRPCCSAARCKPDAASCFTAAISKATNPRCP